MDCFVTVGTNASLSLKSALSIHYTPPPLKKKKSNKKKKSISDDVRLVKCMFSSFCAANQFGMMTLSLHGRLSLIWAGSPPQPMPRHRVKPQGCAKLNSSHLDCLHLKPKVTHRYFSVKLLLTELKLRSRQDLQNETIL